MGRKLWIAGQALAMTTVGTIVVAQAFPPPRWLARDPTSRSSTGMQVTQRAAAAAERRPRIRRVTIEFDEVTIGPPNQIYSEGVICWQRVDLRPQIALECSFPDREGAQLP